MTNYDVQGAIELRKKVDSITKRYNELVKEITKMTEEQDLRELKVKDLDNNILSEIHNIGTSIEEIRRFVENTEKEKDSLAKDFKNIVKKEQMMKLQRIMDKFKFEEYVSKDELRRKLGED